MQTFQAPAGTFAIKLTSFGGKLPRYALRKVFWQQPTPVTSIMDLAYVHRNKPASSNALSDNSRSGKMRRFLASIHKCQTIRKTGPPSSVHTSNYASTRTPPSPRAEYNKWKCPSLPARILLPVCLCFQHLLSNLSLFAARVICRRFGLHKVVNSRGAARI